MNVGNIQIAFISVLCIHMFTISSTVVTLRMSLCNCQNSKKPVVNVRDPLWFYLSLCIKTVSSRMFWVALKTVGPSICVHTHIYIHTCIPSLYVYNVYTCMHACIHTVKINVPVKEDEG